MLKSKFSVLNSVVLFTLISADIPSASNPIPVGIVLAETIFAAGEVGKTTSQPLDVEQNCSFGTTNLNHLDASTRARICSELAQLRESLQRLRIGMASFREFIIANQSRCDQMNLLVIEKTNLLQKLAHDNLSLQKEHDQLKYLLTDFNLNAIE